jgi:ribosome-binding factor A
MAGTSPRQHRVADFIQRELSELIRTELKDPRISPMLTIASVEVSKDLGVARVYYTLLDAEEAADTQEGLQRASGFLRTQIAKSLTSRTVPQLRFVFDDSAAKGAELSALIDNAVKSNTTSVDDEDDRAS